MKLKTLIIIFMALLLLAACTEADPTATPEPEATATAVPATEEAAEPTEAPTTVPDPTEEPPTTDQVPVSGNPAPISNDEGGPVSITGVVTYTAPFFTLGVTSPLVILEDQAGFVDRDEHYIFPLESQTIGQITSDFYTSPFTYSIALPIEPQAAWRDVDFDDEEDQGVQVFAIAYWDNTFGDPFLEERDMGGGGWSGAYASTMLSTDPATEKEIVGGKFLVYAQDDQQQFPLNFGPDGLLFSGDEEFVTLPQGYTVVNLDTDPFTFDRSREQHIDLLEPEGAALVDYSDLSYSEAFDGLINQLELEYAFTDYKHIDWDALRAELRPRFEAAEANEDVLAYRQALRDLAWSIPDGHVSGPFVQEDFREAVLGGIGLALKELDDGRSLVTFLVEGEPAAAAGIVPGAEILAINDVPISEHISQTVSYFGPYSTEHAKRQDQMLFATRFPQGSDVRVSYQNPGGSPQTANLTASSELESYFYWIDDDGRTGLELPVEYEILDEGVGYVQIFSFSDNAVLTVQLWERMIRAFNDEGVSAIIVDMRQNGGGRGFLADMMAAYFFDEELILGNTLGYDKERGEFYMDEENPQQFILPPQDDLYFGGDLVVLVGPDCASACEFFSYDLTLNERATVIGHTPTAGLGGPVDEVKMPEDESFRFTQGRALDPDGNIHIEGVGVVPQLDVPVDEAAILGEDDAVLATAIRFLIGEPFGGETIEGTAVSLDNPASGSLAPNTRVQHVINLEAGTAVNILLESVSGEDLILRILDPSGAEINETEPDTIFLFADLEVDEDTAVTFEIRSADAATPVDYTLSVENSG